ncbi:O-antigen ligase family protein [Paenibacillus taiwanensis]|uniref:O-antigen ligase family protein n=1 Tax=Paenibacillus taiwanensis TaxID=401638 RepID=UPI0003FAFF9E|nr:O-antigen ligase family protein [Paenibacillus taiwanensis]
MQQIYDGAPYVIPHSSSKQRFVLPAWLFYTIVSLTLLLYSWLQQPIYLNAAILMMAGYICVSHAYRHFLLIAFLLPSLHLFVTEDSGVSYATLLFLVALVKYVAARFNTMKLHVVGLIVMLGMIAYEWLHLFLNGQVMIVPAIRWSALFLYASLMIIDMNFKPDFKQVAHYFVAGIVLSSVCGFVMSFANASDAVTGYARFEGAGGDPNGFGMMILMAAFFLLHIYKQSQFPKPQYIYFALGLMLLGLSTLSRAYLLTAAITTVLLAGYMIVTSEHSMIRLRRKLAFAVLVFAAVFTVPAIGFITSIMERMSIGDSLQKMTGLRSMLAQQYWEVFTESTLWEMLWGKGVIGYLQQSNISVMGVLTGPHNTYLESLMAWGMCGTMLFVIYMVVLNQCQKQKVDPGHRPSFLSYLPIISTLIFLLSLQSLAKYSTYFYMTMLLMNMYYCEHANRGNAERISPSVTVRK